MALEIAVVAQRRTGLLGGDRGQRIEVAAGLIDLRRVIMLGRKDLECLVGSVRPTRAVIEVQHSAGFDASAADHCFRCEVELAGLGGDGEILVRLDGPQGAQAESVEACTHDGAVAEDQCRGTIVLLLVEREVLEHCAHLRRHGRIVLPRGRHHLHDSGDEIQVAGCDACRKCLVEAAAVGLSGRADDVASGGPRLGALEQAVLPVGVELTVVGHQRNG